MKQFISMTLALFFILDPLGNVPFFLSILDPVPEGRRKKVISRELFIALVVLLFFYILGNYFVNALHLSQEAVIISGGIILFIIALKMIFPGKYSMDNDRNGEPFIVPLAVPLIAGPSALALVLLLERSPSISFTSGFCAIVTAWTLSSLILYNSTFFYRILGKRGLDAMTKLMGMLLVMMSIQMLISGLRLVFKH
jgi:multiple antibiotic resistance protein